MVLSNSTLLNELRNENFDLAIVDLVYNECSLVRIYKSDFFILNMLYKLNIFEQQSEVPDENVFYY